MIKRISILLLLAALAGCGDSDGKVIEAWISAIEQGDIEAAASITSTPSIVWERGAARLSKQTILGRAIVNPGDLPPQARRIQWHLADKLEQYYMCIDISVRGGKIKVWDRMLFCNEAGVYGIPK